MPYLAHWFPVNPKREMHVETIRGLACFALVSFHVIGNTPTSGMELPAHDWLTLLQECLSDMRMPLFSFVSGYVFVSIARPGQSWLRLLATKARRLLIPMISVATLFWLLRTAMHYSQPPLWEIFLFPYVHFWFLQATFLLMVSLLFLNFMVSRGGGELGPRQAACNAALIGVLGAVSYILFPLYNMSFFSFPYAIHLAVFFMAGHILGMVGKPYFSSLSKSAKPYGGVLLCLMVLLGAALAFGGLQELDRTSRRSLSIVIGLGTALSLFVLQPNIRFFAWVGDKSYAIYLFHVFFTAAALMLWRKLFPGVDIHGAYLPALAAGTFGPILVQKAVLMSPWTAWLFLGLRSPARLSETWQNLRSHFAKNKTSRKDPIRRE